MRRRIRAATLLAVTSLLAVAWADDVDDRVAEMKKLEAKWIDDKKPLDEIEQIMAKRFPREKYRSFHTTWYHVSTARLGDPAWEVPIKPYGTPENYDWHGVQARARWSAGKDAPADQVVCVVVSHEFGKPVKFPKLDREVAPRDVQAFLKAEHETYMKSLVAPPPAPVPPAPGKEAEAAKPDPAVLAALADRKACQEPKKRKVGDFAKCTVTGGPRERREWFAWDDAERGGTFVVTVRFHETAIGKLKVLGKGESYVSAISQ
jgi:hypothetical protein